MRLPLFLGSLPLLLLACSASGTGTGMLEQPADQALPTPLPEAGKPPPPTERDAGGVDSAKPPPKNDCKLPDIKGVADVSPTFLVYAAPGTVPPTMTGGTLKGNYTVDKATVFLPSGSAGNRLRMPPWPTPHWSPHEC